MLPSLHRFITQHTRCVNVTIPISHTTPVGSLSCNAVHSMKEYFGVAYRNHTAWYQLQGRCLSLMFCPVSPDEKVVLNFHFPSFHRDTSSSCTILPLYFLIFSSILFNKVTRWLLLLCFQLYSIVALLGIPKSMWAPPFNKSFKHPREDQDSYQNDVLLPFLTSTR